MGQKNLIHSMTGFASTRSQLGQSGIRLEMKSLNHRYLDIKLRLPRALSSIEFLLRNAIQEKFSRGSLEFKLELISQDSESSDELYLNESFAKKYRDTLETLREQLNIKEAITVRDIALFPDVITRENPISALAETPQELWEKILPAFEEICTLFLNSRNQEGTALKETLLNHLEKIEFAMEEIQSLRKSSVNELDQKIKKRIEKVFHHYQIQEPTVKDVMESRIAQELTIAIEKTDIEEELNRLKSHIHQFKKNLDRGGVLGRKLEFLTQEMGREVNTLGNKAQDIGISEQVVLMKVQLEQIREQVMNIE